ncbi:MAG: hypothetical protein ACT4O1_15300 [Gemmatimonadota bacterium]
MKHDIACTRRINLTRRRTFCSCARLTTVLMLIYVSACADRNDIADPSGVVSPNAATSMTVLNEGNYVEAARLVSVILQQPSERVRLLQMMRKSVWSEHKVDFSEWFQTLDAKELQKVFGSGAERAIADLSRLPSSDLYVLGRASRQSWRGNTTVAVVGTSDPDAATVVVWRPDGDRTVAASTTLNERGVIVLLHPADVRGVRVDRRDRSSEIETIQAADESDLGVARRTGVGTAIVGQPSTRPNGVLYSFKTTNGATSTDYSCAAVEFGTYSHKVDEVGGAEVRVRTFKNNVEVESFTLTGVERLIRYQIAEYAGLRSSEDFESGYGFDYWETDTFSDDYLGTTMPGISLGYNLAYDSENAQTFIYAQAQEIGNLNPVIGSNPQTVLYRGTTTQISVSGDYFMTNDGLSVSGSGLALSNSSRPTPYTWTTTIAVGMTAPAGPRDLTIARAGNGLSGVANSRVTIADALSVTISGPVWISQKGTYTWEAMPVSGQSPYQYSWTAYYPGTGQTISLGTTKTVQLLVSPGERVDLTVIVQSQNGESASYVLAVGEA